MSKFDDLWEDVRLSHVNHGSFRPVFFLLHLLKGLLTFSVIGVCAAGIWYLMYGFESAKHETVVTEIIGGSSGQVLPAQPLPDPLSADRVAMLRDFAEKNRSDVTVVTTNAAPRAKELVESADQVAAASETGLSSIPPADLTAKVEDQARMVFGDLEKRLIARDEQPADGSSALKLAIAEPRLDPPSTGFGFSEADEVIAPLESSNDAVALESDPAETQQLKVNGSDWILAQSGDDFLIQIGSTTNRPFLFTFEKQLPDTQPTAVFEMLIGAGPEHVLTYGAFSSREAAVTELGKLSAVARRYGAYVRKFSVIQDQVRRLDEDLAIAQKAN